MIRYVFLLATYFLGLSTPVRSQVVYHPVSTLPLYGKITKDTETRYERLPLSLKDQVRTAVWDLGKNTAGLYLRFMSNSTSIALKWTVYQDRVMNHMTATGTKGFDLYSLKENNWVFVNSARPQKEGLTHEASIIANMDSSEKEFLLYFPLYVGIVDLYIGVDSAAIIAPPLVELPVSGRPVVCYGTSILQGGCASRPGMAHVSILSRRFNREFINLGFSNNARLDYEIAEIIGDCDASVIVLDFMPNVNVKLIEQNLAEFYKVIRRGLPKVPILFVENPMLPQSEFDRRMKKFIDDKNAALRSVFHELVSDGDQNIFLITGPGMIGTDNEATVDGIHFTDLGFQRYADYLSPYVGRYLVE